MKKILNSGWFYFVIFLIILSFVFRSLLSNLSSNLISWLDYPYVIWVINQNINHIKTLDFANIFNTNAFYPFKDTLLFSDLLLPQSLIVLLVSWFTANFVLAFNVSFLINFVLNYWSLFVFWKSIFKSKFVAFVGAIFFIFCPFFVLQLGHFQMMTYWPFFFCLYFIIKNKEEFIKDYFFAGIFLAIQFLASVYLAVFLCFTIALWFLINFFYSKKRIKNIINFLIIFLTFVLIDGFFIFNYIKMRKEYDIQRNLTEYMQYSAHLSDYLFTTSESILYKTDILTKWNSFNKHGFGERACSVGFLFSLLFIFGFFKFTKLKDKLFLSFQLNKDFIFFGGLIFFGLILSLGPRLNFNGNYAHIPLPYTILLKYFPFFESVRSLARWSFLVYFGVLFFVLSTIKNILNSKYKFLIPIIFVIFAIEYLPVEIKATSESTTNSDYQKLSELCNKDVLLEIPYTHLFGVDGGIVNGLNYISKVELASLEHSCMLVNGYSGYDLPENITYFRALTKSLEDSNYKLFLQQLKEKNVRYVKHNNAYIDEIDRKKYTKMFDSLVKSKKVKKITNSIYEIN